jgi:hypothetical protein
MIKMAAFWVSVIHRPDDTDSKHLGTYHNIWRRIQKTFKLAAFRTSNLTKREDYYES